MANLKDTIVLGNLTVTGTINGTVSGASLPLAANGTRGGIQIGFASTENNRAVALDSEKAYISLPSRINQYKTTVENDPIYSGWYWYSNTSDTSAVAAFGSEAQAATLVSAYNDTWAGQLGISYYSDRVGFRRKQDSATWGNWIELAKKSDIPTKTSQLTNDSKFAVQYSCTNNWIPQITSSGLQDSPLLVQTDSVYCNQRLRGEKFFTKKTDFAGGGHLYVTTLGYAQTLGYSATPVDGQTYLHSIGLDGDGDGGGTSSIFVRVLKVPANTWTTVYNIGNAGVFTAMGCSYQGNRVYFIANGYCLSTKTYNATKNSGSSQISVRTDSTGNFQIKSTVDLTNIAITIFRTYR